MAIAIPSVVLLVIIGYVKTQNTGNKTQIEIKLSVLTLLLPSACTVGRNSITLLYSLKSGVMPCCTFFYSTGVQTDACFILSSASDIACLRPWVTLAK